MHDDTVRVKDAFTVVSGALSQAARGTVALENPQVAMSYADSVTVGGGAASSSSSPTCAATATAGRRTERYAEAIEQAAQLASWEDEGGTTSS